MTCDDLFEGDPGYEEHLATCADCRARKERLDAATSGLGALVTERAQPLSASLRERVLAALPAPPPTPTPRGPRFHPGLLAAALVAVGVGFVVFHAPEIAPQEPKTLHEAPREHDEEEAAVAPLASTVAPPPIAAVASANAEIDSATLAALDEIKVFAANKAITPTEEAALCRDVVNVARVDSSIRMAAFRAVNERISTARKRLEQMNIEREERADPARSVAPLAK